MTGGSIGGYPDYYLDIEDARLLGVRPWEIDEVPMYWRERARVVTLAKKEAVQSLAEKAKAFPVYVMEV